MKLSEYSLSSLYLYLSGKCNLNCRHCWVDAGGRDKKREINYKFLKRAVKEAEKKGLKHIKITGGEPFLRSYALDFISWLRKRNLKVSIETNATLIDRNTSKELKKSKVSFLSVSLDGSTPFVHNKMRRAPLSFNKTLKGVRTAVSEGLKVQIVFSLWNENLSDIEETIKLAVGLGAVSFKINPVSAVSGGMDMKKKFKLPGVKKILSLRNKVREMDKNFKLKIKLDIPPAFLSLEELKELRVCPVKNILAITSDGTISICGIAVPVKSLSMGNVKDVSISRVWDGSSILNEIRSNLPGKLEGICGKCFFKYICLGKCRAEAYFNSNSLYSPHPFCSDAFKKGIFPLNYII